MSDQNTDAPNAAPLRPAIAKLDPTLACTAFQGLKRVASGLLVDVAAAVKAVVDRGDAGAIAIFDDASSRPIEIDFRGSFDDVRRQLATPGEAEAEGEAESDAQPRGPGRPKLGVVAREVTLLPRHWDWLTEQPGGASVTLRRLVEAARRSGEGAARIRGAQEAANRFMTAMAGDLPGYEEATRALFAGDGARFALLTEAWPPDIRDHSRRLAAPAFASL